MAIEQDEEGLCVPLAYWCDVMMLSSSRYIPGVGFLLLVSPIVLGASLSG